MADTQKAMEMFNAAEADNRQRADFLAKAIFLIGGGALTVSMNIFLGGEHPTKLPEALHHLLVSSWRALLYSMACYVLVIGLMILRDYVIGENWRRKLGGKKQYFTSLGPYYIADIVLWALGIIGLIYLFIGLHGLSKVAGSLLRIIN